MLTIHIDTLVDDILNIIKEHENISKEVMDMLLEEYKTIADVRIEKAEQKSRQEEREEGIRSLVKSLKNLKIEDNKILEQLQEVYNLSKEQAEKYLSL